MDYIKELDKLQLRDSDRRIVDGIKNLKVLTDWDNYVLLCVLCSYAPTKELIDLRYKLKDTPKVLHTVTDYKKNIRCVNLKRQNQYKLYEFSILSNDRSLVSALWNWKNQDCLKYVAVDGKTITVSISKNQFNGFVSALDALAIQYDINDLRDFLFYDDKSDIEKADSSFLPFTLFDFQQEDVDKIIQHKRMLLGHEMGCGKTIMSIVVGQNIKGRKLVICPESLRLNWKHEIERCGCQCEILLSSDEYHIGTDWTIVGFQTAYKYYKQLKKDFNCLFVDEVHKCKAVDSWGNPSSQRAKAVARIANNCEYCYLLTGTPIPSSNRDLYNILKLLRCDDIDKFTDYAYRYCGAVQGRFGLEYTGNTNAKELNSILDKHMIRRLKKDVLPNLRKQRQFIPIQPKFRRDYKDIEHRLYFPKDGDSYMSLAMTGRRILSDYKIDTAISLAEDMLDSEQQVVLVTNFVDTAKALKDHFGDNACEITGGQSYEARDYAQYQFQNGQKKVCILNMQAGGVGLNLTAACNMIILDYSWIPADCIQTEDRICRPGQNECCNIYYVYCMNSIFDKLFCQMMTEKADNIAKVVDDSENAYNLEKELASYIATHKEEK